LLNLALFEIARRPCAAVSRAFLWRDERAAVSGGTAMRLPIASLLLFVGLAWAGSAAAEQRLALVVGNNAYEQVPQLKKAVNDADAVAKELGALGFAVDLVENATRNDLSRKLVEFERKVASGDVVLFYFAGHGFEIRGDNYLLPTDVPQAREGEEGLVKDASFAAKDIMDRLQERGAGTLILVLDACRDNPFARPGQRSLGGETRGLARVEPTEGVFVVFSAGAKQTALDELSDADPDPNSVFTRIFVKTLAVPGLSLVDIAKTTQTEVKALAATAGHEQTPAYYDQVVGNFFLVPAAKRSADPEAAWAALASSNDASALSSYLVRFGDAAPHAGEARQRLAMLTPQPKPPAAPANAEALATACIALTAQPGDPANNQGSAPVTPVAYDALDAVKAEAACRQARALLPHDARVTYGLARSLEKAGRLADAMPLYEEAAGRGEAAAANRAGEGYYSGDGVNVDFARARFYFEKAVHGGYYGSVLRYADMLDRGLGGTADPALALGTLRAAANAGVAEAAFDIGTRYDQAVGVARDARQARQWYELAVARGYPFAAFSLAFLVGHGQGGPVDRDRAADLIIQAFAGDADPKTSDDMREMLKRFDKRVILALQQKLAAVGADPGKIDGRIDEATYHALDQVAARRRQESTRP
jgi:TPR repeat protein